MDNVYFFLLLKNNKYMLNAVNYDRDEFIKEIEFFNPDEVIGYKIVNLDTNEIEEWHR